MRIHIETAGCRVNRHDGAALAADFAARGWEVVSAGEPCDVRVLNSCVVTEPAEAEGRRWLARARSTGDALVVVAGCAAQVGALEADVTVGTADKARLGDLLDARFGRAPASPSAPPALPADGRSSRFFYKVQEGCDVRCAFCIIPDARGRSRSLPPDEVLAVLARAAAAGFNEAVLAGIHLGGYGRDLPGGASLSLAELCRRALDETGLARLRLGSLEPWGLRPDLAALFRDEPRLMPFVHLPLQSGSDRVLRLMRRPITAAGYLRAAERALSARPELGLFIDVLVGFPGEGEAEFAETVALLDRLPWTRLHVFPYSERPGTPAAAARELPRVPEPAKRARARQLLDWSAERFRARLRARAGSLDEVVVEAERRGHTRDNLPVRLRGTVPARRALARVALEEVEETPAGPVLGAAPLA